MITAVFTDNDDYARVYGLWQWDYGQELRIQGLHLPTAVEIHFALQEVGGEALTRVGTTKDGVITVTIPDSMLEGAGATKDYQIYAWIYLSDRTSGETIKRITMHVKARSKPEAFDAPGDGEIFHQAIEAVNDAAKRAEDAGDKAIAAGDEAKAAAAQTAEHLEAVQGLAEQVETNADTVAQNKQAVAGMLSQTQQAASEAALSAQAAKLSETAAAQAQTAAETAEDTARQYAEDTGADRQAVEQTAAQFGQAAQDALTAIGQAQSTAVGAVKAEGGKQTTAVQEAGTQAVDEVTEAKTAAVQAVTTEGDKQAKRVEDAAAGIVEDREQISQNKTDIADLAEGMTDLAPAIHSTASGSVITADDAAEGRPFRGFWVFGKSTQDGTPTPEAPVPIVSAGEGGSIEVAVMGQKLLKPDNRNVFYELPLNANTIITLMTNGEPSEGGNIKFIGTDDSNVWFSIEKGQTRVCKSIGSKPVKGFYDLLSPKSGLEYMLAVGDIKTYEPYREPQTLTLATPNGLSGIPVSKDGNYTDENGQQWICDEVDLERGKYVQRIGEYTYSLKDDWFETSNNRFTNRSLRNTAYYHNNNNLPPSVTIMCDYFKQSNKVNTDDFVICVNWNGDVVISQKDIKTLYNRETIKEFMNGKTVKYVLKAPIERDLTPEEIAAYKALRTYSPTTVISNDAGAGMEVTYVADTKTYIDNKFAALNKAVLDAVGGI